MTPGEQTDAALRCSFCGKSEGQVKKLISGPSVRICDQCVKICNEILADNEVAARVEGSEAGAGEGTLKEFHVGNFACPNCGGMFALHARQPRRAEE